MGAQAAAKDIRGAIVFASIMGPPLAIRMSHGQGGSMLCTWHHPELHEYEMPATSEFVIGLQTLGAGARTKVGRGWSTVAPVGSLHVIPPQTPTRWKVDGNLGFLSVHVATERIRTLLERDGSGTAELRDLVFRFAVRDPYLSASSRELARELRSSTEAGSLYADLLADSMILRVLRLGNQAHDAESGRRRGLSTQQLETVREKIEASLESGVSLAQLASEVGLSRFHFARAFKSSMGMPPHRYMTLRRVERAKQLLSDREKALVDVALEAGFSSQSHFTGRFREITGTTPLRYRLERG